MTPSWLRRSGLDWRVDPRWLIVTAGIAAYANSLSGAFIFDDILSIVENPTLRKPWCIWTLLSAFAPETIRPRPVASLSLALNYQLGGVSVFGYHVVNLLLHLAAALTLFGIVRRTLQSPPCTRAVQGPRMRESLGHDGSGFALAVTLIWMVHPLLTESVDYVTQRTELLMGLFLLLTLYGLIRGVSSGSSTRWYPAAVVSCALGMGSKETMVVAPILVGLYDWVFLADSFRELWRARRSLYAGLAGTWFLLAALLVISPRTDVAGFHVPFLTPLEYAATQCGVILHYLRLAFWPHPLIFDYAGWPVVRTVQAAWSSLLIVTGLIAMTIWAVRRRAPSGFLGGWFFLLLAPTSSFFPIATEFVAERRMYLPLAAIVTMVVVSGWQALRFLLEDQRLRRRAASGVMAFLVMSLGALTIRRNEDYRTERSMWTDTVAKNPRGARVHYNLGVVFQREGEVDAAIAAYQTVLRIAPHYVRAHFNLGHALAEQGRFPEALAQYREAIRLDPEDADSHYNLAMLLEDHEEFPEAMAQYEEVLRLRPTFVKAHNNLAALLVRVERLTEALEHYRQALQLDPTAAAVSYNMGLALVKLGSLDEAIAQYQHALQLAPHFPEAQQAFEEAVARLAGPPESGEMPEETTSTQRAP